LPKQARLDTRDAYRTFKVDPFTPRLHFKEIYADSKKSVWSARTSKGWRVIGVRILVDYIVWFWVGSHAEYDNWFRRFEKMQAPK
jgi:hypothetical protein